jgi:hypothetical protein
MSVSFRDLKVNSQNNSPQPPHFTPHQCHNYFRKTSNMSYGFHGGLYSLYNRPEIMLSTNARNCRRFEQGHYLLLQSWSGREVGNLICAFNNSGVSQIRNTSKESNICLVRTQCTHSVLYWCAEEFKTPHIKMNKLQKTRTRMKKMIYLYDGIWLR